MPFYRTGWGAGLALLFIFGSPGLLQSAPSTSSTAFANKVDALAAAFMEKNELPGLAIGVTRDGRDQYFSYGLASKEDGQKVTSSTLFEMGSISKTFTVTLATYAEVQGKLRLTDTVADHLPEFRGTPFGKIMLRNMGTHTAGKFPFRLPPDVNTYEELVPNLKKWRSPYPQGTKRKYATATIGMMGRVAASALETTYSQAVDTILIPKMGLTQTFIDVPAAQMTHYAQGYTTESVPRRIGPKILADEAYGVKSSAGDMIRYMKIQMGEIPVEPALADAIRRTHLGYFDCGYFVQELMWERSPWPVSASTLEKGNGRRMVTKDTATTAILHPKVENRQVLIGKTGSTRGFGTYVAYVPEKKIGVTILANRYHPSKGRVELARQLLKLLESDQ